MSKGFEGGSVDLFQDPNPEWIRKICEEEDKKLSLHRFIEVQTQYSQIKYCRYNSQLCRNSVW